MATFAAGYSLGVPRRSVAPTVTAGESGIPIFGGRIYTPEKDPRVVGTTRYKTYGEILANVDIVTAGVRYFGDLVAQSSWKFEPSDDSAEAHEFAEFVEEVFDDMTTPLHRVVRRLAMFKLWGFAVAEWTAKKRDDGKIGLLDVEPRPQRTIDAWDVDTTGTVFGCVQRSEVSAVDIYLPRSKIVHVVDDSIDASPEGWGLFRGIVRHATTLMRLEDVEGFGYETDIRGMPLIRAPLMALRNAVAEGRMTKAEAEAILAPLSQFLSGHVKSPSLGLLLDSAVYTTTDSGQAPSSIRQYDVEVVRQQADGMSELAAAIERKTRGIARILGVEFLLLGSDSKGSYALAEGKATSFGLLVDSALTEIGKTIEADLVHTLALLNGVDRELEPKLVPDRARFRDVQEITGALKDLATAGAPLGANDEAAQEVRALLGLSRAPEVEEIELDAMLPGASSSSGGTSPSADPSGDGPSGDESGTVVSEDQVNDAGSRPQGNGGRGSRRRGATSSGAPSSNGRAPASTGR